jgi:aarF domain-containing kinase
MIAGVFNGDPHPGNILLLKDGRIGLIDYGQTKRLTDEQRLIVARCFLALAQHDGERLVNYALSTGATWKRNDPYVIEKTATAFLDRDDPIVTNGKNLQLFFEDMHNRDPAVTTSNFFIMVGRMSILLRAITYAFNSPVSFATISRPITEQVLLKEGNDQDKKWASFKGLHPTGLMKDYPPL